MLKWLPNQIISVIVQALSRRFEWKRLFIVTDPPDNSKKKQQKKMKKNIIDLFVFSFIKLQNKNNVSVMY